MKYQVIGIVFFIGIILAGCSGQQYPQDVSDVLKAAGDNRAELEKVINHYKNEGDSLKLQAAYFLIGNMREHCYVTYQLIDSSKTRIDFDALSYPNYKAVRYALDSIEATRGELDYDRLEKIDDMTTISADFLIKQIDEAFEVWREKPWAKKLTFKQFCRYVLPYRGSNEPLEDWRSYFMKKYADIATKLKDSTNPIEAAAAINNDVKSWFGFDERYYLHPTDQGLTEMLNSGLGRCEDMTNMTIYALRANGIAVTSDYTPYWANTGNNHAWNAILTSEGKVVPFMGAESNVGDYKLYNKAAKVYRKTFDQQKNNLVFQKRKQEKMPGWLAGKYYIDVTPDYVNVCDVTVKFTEEIPDSIDIAYLCVFNDGHFCPIHWGRIENGQATFSDMGRGILYLPASYQNKEVVPLGSPFILNEDCTMTELTVNPNQTVSVELKDNPMKGMAGSTETIVKARLKPGTAYELFYWDGSDWKSFIKFTAKSKSFTVNGLPGGGLYWLKDDNTKEDERVFTIKDGNQLFW